jgi:hypothetical protein
LKHDSGDYSPRTVFARFLKPYLPTWQTVQGDFGLFNPRHGSPLLQLLLLTDVAFVLLHLLLFYSELLNNELFSLRRDKGYPEFFQYLKELWIALLFVRQTLRTSDPRYLVWSALFAYMLADDYLMLHENIGAAAANSLGIVERWGLRGQDFGELGFYLVVGGTFCVLLVLAYGTGSVHFRRNSVALFALLLLFALFAVAGDLLHIILPFPALDRVFDVLEDGSEMIVMSLILWYVYACLRGAEPANTHAPRGGPP